MKKFMVTLISLVIIGLVIVYGEVEAMKVGYEIRKLGIRKRELTHQLKESEYGVATLTAPERLERTMNAYHVKLVNPTLLRVAKLPQDQGLEGQGRQGSNDNAFLARFLVPSAQADTTR